MAEVKFIYEGTPTIIQCNINDKMEDIIALFLTKIDKKEEKDNLYYLYNGTKINNKEITFSEQANELDKKSNKMNILVYQERRTPNITNRILSKDIICPICKENTLIDFKNFKINFHGCKNDHNIKDISLNIYEEIQKIDLGKIVCNICNTNNKGETKNNQFFICNTCNKNLCPLCKSIHDQNHMIINYDDKNYICKKHKEPYTKYCEKCKEDLCIICENEHENHKNIDFSKILFTNKNELMKIKDELNQEINNFKYEIEIIKNIFDIMINLLDKYYKINNEIINNYDLKKRNYFTLQNIINLKKKDEELITILRKIITEGITSELYNFSVANFYNLNGEKYIGEMKKNGLKEGKGILYFIFDKDKKKYKGDFKNNKMEGKGILYYNNGDRYEGDFKNDKMEGKGRFYWIDGNRYEGEVKNNNREGEGTMIYNNGNKYEGFFKNDKKEGKGIMCYNNGAIYDGNFKNNIKEGNGIYFYKNGNKYVGEWKNDKAEGK